MRADGKTWWDQLDHDVIPFLPSVRESFSHHSLGSVPTKQLACMGIPALLSCRSLPPFSISLPLSLFAAGPRTETAKFIFSTVVPLRWRRGPCHTAVDVLGEGPWRDVGGTLLLLHHSILLLLKDSWYCPFCTWAKQSQGVTVIKVSHISPASHWKVIPMKNKAKLAL